MYILIDNYDSFTYNLWHYLGELGATVEVYRNDQIAVAEVLARRPEGVIVSPGPCDPDRAGICLELVTAAAETRLPFLGVCLGHQSLGQALGGRVIRAPEPVHGKVMAVHHSGHSPLFAGIPETFNVTRYHSLVVEEASLPTELVVTCRAEDGLIMGLDHTDLPLYGVQFHPESIASEHGHRVLANFLQLAGQKDQAA